MSGSLSASSSRPRPQRAAAASALAALDATCENPLVIDDSDGRDSGDDELEGESEAEEEEPQEADGQLSAYEQQRLENIARNKAVLVSLGLEEPSDAASSKAKKPRASGTGTSSRGAATSASTSASSSAAPARKERPARSSPASSSTTATATTARTAGKRKQAEAASARDEASSTGTGTSAGFEFAEDAEEVEAYYRLLCGAPIPGEGTALLSVASLRRAARELRFDLDERQAHLMISQFDRGRGALSLDDFRRVVRVAGRAP